MLEEKKQQVKNNFFIFRCENCNKNFFVKSQKDFSLCLVCGNLLKEVSNEKKHLQKSS